MIEIHLVVVDGRLVGRDASSRWNLMVLFGENHRIYEDRSQAGLKAARRRLTRMGLGDCFKLVQCRGCLKGYVERPSRAEVVALEDALPLVVERHFIPVIA